MSCVARVIALMPVIIARSALSRRTAPRAGRARPILHLESAPGRRGIAMLDFDCVRQACAAVATLAAIGRERRHVTLLHGSAVWGHLAPPLFRGMRCGHTPGGPAPAFRSARRRRSPPPVPVAPPAGR